MRRRLLGLVLCLLLGWPLCALATRQAEPVEEALDFAEGQRLLERWQAEAARQWAEARLAREPSQPQWHFLHGQALFYLGEYSQALEAFARALALLPHPHFQAYRDFVAQTLQSTAALKRLETPHFSIFLDPERDAALVPYVAEVLERSYQRLGELFGYFPAEKVRVEIFPTPETFYPASSLSARDIEVSGAIGICKFNKIMLLSPRNLLRGYRWSDALSHEYLHYLLVHLSGNRAPIWLHEGIAKYFEAAWRQPQLSWLDRRTETLLAQALQSDGFVGFKNMEPSLVKLDTTYQVQLAYAEAASAIAFLVHRLGTEGLVRLLRALPQAGSAAEALARVMGLSFEAFEQAWRQFLQAQGLRVHPGVHLPQFTLKQGGVLSEDEVRREIASAAARMHARLGDRLRQRGRAQAAAREYRRALTQEPYSPYLLNKLAMALMAQGAWQQALAPLHQARDLDPDYVTTYTNLGRLHLVLKQPEAAFAALWEAVQINPFDPDLHRLLAEVYRQRGDEASAAREYQLFQRLQEKSS
ncbi:MAG: hypothetical protein KatS3mg131_2567 [Candidatus Tectimicrobiota bacterium]|nr:MAG: hypothetical protein KatS3mg131_2567 [Candidatus Tectomicrobia bacterium]